MSLRCLVGLHRWTADPGDFRTRVCSCCPRMEYATKRGWVFVGLRSTNTEEATPP